MTTWPGQPLSTTDLQRLYPTTDHPAPFRPHKPWNPPEAQPQPPQPHPTPRHSTRGSMTHIDVAHRLITALADRLITKELAHAYLHADLNPEQLDHILKAHTKPAPAQQPPHTFPGLYNPMPTMPKFGTLGWQFTSYPGKPLPSQEYHQLNTATLQTTTANTVSRMHRKPSH